MTRLSQKLIRSLLALSLLLGFGISAIGASPVGASTQDGTTAALTDDSPSAKVVRLFEAFFKRSPSDSDRAFWVGELNKPKGTYPTLDHIANFFATSDEFKATYGDDTTSEEFVALVYNNVLDRGPDDDGFWSGEIDAGNRTRGTVMTGFSEGPEFKEILLARFDDSAIFRLYCAYFLREPDAGGRMFWKSEAANGRPIVDIADAFAGVPEFEILYGANLSDAAFVDTVYLNVLDRPREAAETFWLDKLTAGEFTRGRVMVGFSEAPEYINRFSGETCPTNTNPPPGGAPVAVNDTATTSQGVGVAVNVLSNDTANGGSVTGFSEPANGSVTQSGDILTYTPNTGYTGDDSFTYTLTNATTSDIGTVNVTVNVAGSPTASADTLDANYNPEGSTTTSLNVTENDTTNGAAIASAGSAAGGGTDLVSDNGSTLAISGGSIIYTPQTDGYGSDTFTYTLGAGATASTATVTVNVGPLTTSDVNCETYLAPPITGDATTDPVGRDAFTLFLRSGGCFQPYENMPGGSGTLHQAYSGLTIAIAGGAPMAVTATQSGSGILHTIDIDPADYSVGDSVVLTGDLTLHDMPAAGPVTVMTNIGFTGTWTVTAAGVWAGVSGTQAGITLVVDPLTGS